MENLLLRVNIVPVRTLIYSLCLIFFTVTFAQQGKSQSLFEIAIGLDTLYDKLKTDSTAAKAFFTELQKLYSSEGTFEAKDIRNDVKGNRFLAKKVDLAYEQFKIANHVTNDIIGQLKIDRDSLISQALAFSKEACKNNCDFRSEIFELEGMISNFKDGLETNENVLKSFEKLTKASETTLPLKTELEKIKREIVQINISILEEENASESVFVQSSKASNMMPINSVSTLNTVPQIVIQNQGGGSAQSAVIDGTAKWIAERMRQELSIAFFDKFENWAEGENIKVLFPNTFSVLKSSATTDYALMIKIFKTAFEKDLNHLTFNLSTFLQGELVNQDTVFSMQFNLVKAYDQFDLINRGYDKYINDSHFQFELIRKRQNLLYALDNEEEDLKNQLNADINRINNEIASFNYDKYAEEYMVAYNKLNSEFEVYQEANKILKYINFSIEAIKQLSEGSHPSTLLSFLNDNLDEMVRHDGNLQSATLLLDVLSRSLMKTGNTDGETVWISQKDIQRLSKESQIRGFYFGLIYQEIKQSIRWSKTYWEGQKEHFLNADTLSQNQQYTLEEDLYQKRIEISNFLFSSRLDILNSEEENPYLLWESILKKYKENYYPFDEDSTSLKKNLGYALDWYQDAMQNNEELASFYPAFKNSVRLLKEEMKITEDYLRGICKEVSDDNEFLTLEVYLEYFNRINLPFYEGNLIQKEDLKNSYYLSDLNSWIIPLLKNPQETPASEINSMVLKHAKKRIEINEKYDIDSKLKVFEKIENEIIERYNTDVLVADSILRAQEIQNGNFNMQWDNMELKILAEQERFFNDLILDPQYEQRFGEIVNGFIQFTSNVNNINKEFKRLREDGKANLGNQEFVFLLKNSLDAINLVFDIALYYDKETMTTVQSLSTNLLDAYAASIDKDYDALVMNIIPVVELLVEKSYDKKIKPLENEYWLTNPRDETDWEVIPSTPELDRLREAKDKKLRKVREVFKYSAFLAAVVESRNSEEVKRAIQAIALPVGSYSIKRRTYRNISLNAYPGITGGMELIKNVNASEWAPNIGFTAPIGLAVSWGYRSKVNESKYHNKLSYRNRIKKAEINKDGRFLNGSSGSIFFPLVDLGALVLFRLNDSEEPLPEDVGLKQIFSPGVMYVHGFRGVPVSLMGGFQMSPQLRKIGEDTANSFRFNLSLVVDLPIANFHTRRRMKRDQY